MSIIQQKLFFFKSHLDNVKFKCCLYIKAFVKVEVKTVSVLLSPDMKKAQAPQACLGNILDGWGTFWTKIYAVLSHFTVCRKLRIFHKVFKVKMGTLSPKKGVMTH